MRQDYAVGSTGTAKIQTRLEQHIACLGIFSTYPIKLLRPLVFALPDDRRPEALCGQIRTVTK